MENAIGLFHFVANRHGRLQEIIAYSCSFNIQEACHIAGEDAVYNLQAIVFNPDFRHFQQLNNVLSK